MNPLKTFLTLSALDRKISQPDHTKLIKYAKSLPKLDSLFLLSRIDNWLTKNNQTGNNVQEELVDQVFNKEIAVSIKSLLSIPKFDAVFHSQQIYYCMGLILKHGSSDKRPSNLSVLKEVLGHLLLYVSEFCNFDLPEYNSIQEKQKQSAIMLWQMGHFYDYLKVDLGSELARVYTVYNSEEGKTFAIEFKKATGIDLYAFWTISYVIYSQLLRSSKELIPRDVILDHNIFSSFNGIKMEDVNKILSLLSADMDHLEKIYTNKIESFDNKQFNFEFLRDKPLLEFEPGKYICLSMPYLIKKTTCGVLEIVKEKIGSDNFNKQISNIYGKCYESYVTQISKEAYNSSVIERFLKRKSKRIEVADGVIDYGDEAIFLEVKAVSIEKQYRLTNTYEGFKKALYPFLIKKGALQLDKRILEFKTGKIKIQEINPNRIHFYYPVLITCLDTLPQYHILSEEYQKILQKYHILQEFGVAKLTILNISEYEAIMELVEQGHSFIDILKEKLSDTDMKNYSMINFLLSKHNITRPRHLQKTLEQIGNGVLSYATHLKEE